jgi:protoporphyrinogen/coproporphyrinogen III oxidase
MILGKLDPNCRELDVVGGGIAGLLAAWWGMKQGLNVRVFEANATYGGLITSELTEFGYSEGAVSSIMVTPKVTQFFEEIGVIPILLNKNNKARYVLRDNKLCRWPLNFAETLNLLYRATFKKAQYETDYTMDDWGCKHLGKPAVKYLIAPMITGIYGATPEELAVFPFLNIPNDRTLLAYLLKKPKTKNKPYMAWIQHGMSNIIKLLLATLTKSGLVKLYNNTTIADLSNLKSQQLLAVPAEVAANLISSSCQLTATKLNNISYSPLVSVTVIVKGIIPNGVGVLIPKEENRQILGILFCSSAFPEMMVASGYQMIRVFLGGTRKRNFSNNTDESINKIVATELQEILRLNQNKIVQQQIYRWPKGVPIYNHELYSALTTAKDNWCATPGKLLFGNYTGNVSIRRMIEEVV